MTVCTTTSAVVFDLDGTLIDSGPDIAIAANKMLHKIGKSELPLKTIERFIGHGASMLVAKILAEVNAPTDEDTVKDCTALYTSFYQQEPVVETRFFENVVEDLKYLKKSGLKLGICTNKSHALTQNILQKLGIDHLFSAVAGADIVPRHKPDAGHLRAVANDLGLKTDEIIYVGDTDVDALCAQNAGVRFFVVSWGGGSSVHSDHATRIKHLQDVLSYINISAQ